MPMSWKTDMSSLIMKAGDDSINIYMQYGELNHLLTYTIFNCSWKLCDFCLVYEENIQQRMLQQA